MSFAGFEMVVGLEVHVQLGTASKLFCSCPTDSFGEAPNTRICPVCTGQPGVLPVLNRGAVERACMAALALGCRLQERSVFARKNYFYPDLPKGYQVSQFELPFARDGAVELPGGRRIGLARIHMEEDAGKLLHAIGSESLNCSLADLNRAGIPLIEIVSKPEISSPEEADAYLTSLKAVLRYCGISSCDMEKGELRCDANISVRRSSEASLGTRTEIKNLNSFKSVRDALSWEFDRQCAALGSGGTVVQETRLWDAGRGATAPMRSKEEAEDYRYFPDPDLVPLVLEPAWTEALRGGLPELPAARERRFRDEFGLSGYDAGVLTAERPLADYFEAVVRSLEKDGPVLAKTASNWVQSEVLAQTGPGGSGVGEARVRPEALARLIGLIHSGRISGKIAKGIFPKMWETGKDPEVLVAESGLEQVSDEGRVSAWVEEAIEENPKAFADVKAGKKRAVGAIVGAVMKKSKGKANPGLVNRLIEEKIR